MHEMTTIICTCIRSLCIMWGYSWTRNRSQQGTQSETWMVSAGDVQEKTACYGNVLAPECILLSSHVIPTFFFRWVCPRWEWTTPWLQWTQPFDCRGPVGCHQKRCRPMVKIRTFQSGGQELGARGHVQWFCKDSFVSPCDWGSTVKLSLCLGFDGRESGVKISWRLVNVFGKTRSSVSHAAVPEDAIFADVWIGCRCNDGAMSFLHWLYDLLWIHFKPVPQRYWTTGSTAPVI